MNLVTKPPRSPVFSTASENQIKDMNSDRLFQNVLSPLVAHFQLVFKGQVTLLSCSDSAGSCTQAGPGLIPFMLLSSVANLPATTIFLQVDYVDCDYKSAMSELLEVLCELYSFLELQCFGLEFQHFGTPCLVLEKSYQTSVLVMSGFRSGPGSEFTHNHLEPISSNENNGGQIAQIFSMSLDGTVAVAQVCSLEYATSNGMDQVSAYV